MKATLILTSRGVREANACYSALYELEQAGWDTELWLFGAFEQPLYPASEALRVEAQGLDLDNDAERLLAAAEMLWRRQKPDLLLMPEDLLWIEVCPRLSARTAMAVFTGCSALLWRDDRLEVEKSVYGGNVNARFALPLPCAMTLRTGELTPYVPSVHYDGPITSVPFDAGDSDGLELVEYIAAEGDGLEEASRLLIAGQGVGGGAAVAKLQELAARTNTALGCTRPLVQNGLMPPGKLVGATGVTVSPETAIVFGASGSGPFMSGMRKAGTIAAINNDPAAPIFRQADVGAVADCNAVAEALLDLLDK